MTPILRALARGRGAVLVGSAASVALASPGLASSTGPNVAPSLDLRRSHLAVAVGTRFVVRVRATDQDSRNRIRIRALFLPPRATLRTNVGNPASATFSWRPTRPGTYVVPLTAQDSGSPSLSVTRLLTVTVHPRPLVVSNPNGLSHWSFVRTRVLARSAPSRHARVVGSLRTRTPEGTQNLVLLIARVVVRGREWYRVRLPMLPNNSTGWVPAAVLDSPHVVRTHLVVDRRTLRATLFRNGRKVFSTPVGVGRAAYPTPHGQFYIRDLVIGYVDPSYGPAAFGTSARSHVLTDWPAGGYIGIHGTNAPHLLPGRISHGCIRMTNAAISTLRRLMPIGTPLTIR